VAASNRNLAEAVDHKTFRADLFYRLNVFPIVIPPLRERPEDIPPLVSTFVEEFSRSLGKESTVFPASRCATCKGIRGRGTCGSCAT
jgi:hydrogenase-4 transcriptional activator